MPRRDEGSILKELKNGKHTGRWYARLRYTDRNGKRCEKKRTCPTFAAAKAEILNLKSEIGIAARDRWTYRQLDEFYRSQYVRVAQFASGVKISGFKQDLRIIAAYLNVALEHFGDTPIDTIGFADLENYKREIAGRPTIHSRQRSIADVNQNLRRLNRLFTVAIEQGKLDVNPFKRGKGLIASSQENERTRVLTHDEERRLLAECETPTRRYLIPLIIFAIETAARKNEILAVQWFDVNFIGKSIRVRNKSANAETSRLVPMAARLAEILAQLRQNSVGRLSARVFGVKDFKKAFNGALRDAELYDVHFHDLRHTGITRMVRSRQLSIPEIMKISGHTQLKTFLRYLNLDDFAMSEISARLSSAA